VNDALSRAYANALTGHVKTNVRISLTDNNFMLTFSKRIPAKQVPALVDTSNFEHHLRSAVMDTELFKQRFRHVANRSFAILKSYKGRQISLGRQHRSTERMLDSFSRLKDFPVIEETFNEILHDAMDLDNAMGILKEVESNHIELVVRDYSEMPTPFSHGVILSGMSDIVMMEDRSALLRELHRRILDRVVEGEERKFKYKTDVVENYFEERRPIIESRDDIPGVLEEVGAVHIFDEKQHKLSDYAPGIERSKLYDWCIDLVNSGQVVSIAGNRWISARDLPYYSALFARQPPSDLRGVYERMIGGTGGTEGQTGASTGVPADLLADLKEAHLKSLEKTLAVHLRFRPLKKGEKTRPSFTRLEDILKERRLKKDYFVLVPGRADFEESIDRVVIQCLTYYAPCTMEEIAYRTGISDRVLEQALRELEDRSVIAAGYFVAEKTLLQYMLARDVIYLDAVHRGGHRVFEYEKAQWLNYEKYYGCEDIDAYFDRFGFVPSPRVLFNGVKNFDAQRWRELRADGRIVEGRFMRGRVGYVRREDIPLFTAAYREEYLSRVDRAVLDFLEENGESYRSIIVRNVDAGEEAVNEAIDRLDRNLHIYRKYRPGYEYYSINFYALLDPLIETAIGTPWDERKGTRERTRERMREQYTRQEAQRILIERFVKGHSPVSLNAIRRETGFDYGDVTGALADLEGKGLVQKILVTGDVQGMKYIWHEDLPLLENLGTVPPAEPRMAVPWSPYLRRRRRQLRSLYGDMISGIVLIDREPEGAILHFRMSGCVEVRGFNLGEPQNTGKLSAAVKALDGLLDYYRTTGVDILRLTSVGGKPVKELDRRVLAVFKKAGYKRVQSWLLKGNIVHRTYDFKEVLSYVLWRQHIFRNNLYPDVLTAIEKMGGARSDLELALRVYPDTFMSLEECHRHHGIVRGKLMFGYQLHCSLEQAGLWSRAMGHELDEVEKKILNHMPSPSGKRGNDMISGQGIREFMGKTGLAYTVFQKGLKKLYEKGAIVRLPYGKYAPVPASPLSVEEARKQLIFETIHNFGVASVEQLISLTRGTIRTGQVRRLLRELEEEGKIVKGYFIRGDTRLYYMEKGAEKKVLRHSHREGFVLTPMDRLFYYLSDKVREMFGLGSCYVIIHNAEMIAVFLCRKKGKTLSIKEYYGDAGGMPIAEEWARRVGIGLEWEIEELNGMPLEEVLG